MVLGDLSRRPLLDTAYTAAWVTLLLAPQLTYLETRAASPGLSAVLTVWCATVFGVFHSRLLAAAVDRWTSSNWQRTEVLLAVAQLPLVALWLPRFSATTDLGARPHLIVIALWVLAQGGVIAMQLLHHGSDGAARRAAIFTLTTGFALAGSLLLRAVAHTSHGLPWAAWGWGLYLLMAMVGWGRLVNGALLADEDLDWGQRAALGMAVLIIIGGLLNVSWSISPMTVLMILAVGAGAFAASFTWPRKKRLEPLEPSLVILAVLIAAVGLVLLASSPAGTIDTVNERPAFDLHDDLQAYLVFPEKMLQTGSMGPEPFEARRMLSMGGQTFLQALILAGLPMRCLHLVEQGVMPLILLGLVLGFGRRHRLDPRLTVFAALLVLSFPHLAMRGNTSAALTGVVLLLSLFRLLSDGSGDTEPALIAIVAAGLCALKSTFIPSVVFFILISALFALYRGDGNRRLVARHTLFSCGLTALLTLPWMISILESSGTLLYPVFGRGFYGGTYTNGFANIADGAALPLLEVVRSGWRHLVRLLPILLLVVFVREKGARRPALALAVTAAISVLLLVALGDPEINRGITRYAFPISMTALVGITLAAFRNTRGESARSLPAAAVAGLVIGATMMLLNQDAVRKTYDQVIVNLFAAVDAEDETSPFQHAAAAEMEESMAGDGALLATIERPYLLDFTRRPVFIMSLPGMAGLAPGLPVFEGGEKVADYLLGHSIRYLAYGGYGDVHRLLKLTENDITSRYPNSRMRWIMLRYHQRYNEVVEELADSRKRLYQDDGTVVLDLTEKVRTLCPAEHPERVSGFVDDVWTDGQALIEDLERSPSDTAVVLRTRGWRVPEPDRSTVKVFADGHELELVAREDRTLVFRLIPAVPPTFDIEIRSSEVDHDLIGARASVLPLGLDIDAVEVVERDAAVGLPTHRSIQLFGETIDPADVWTRTGFFRDNNWTDGDATLDGLSWLPARTGCTLTVSLYDAHPWAKDLERLAPRVFVNGIELRFDHAADQDLVFHLYEGLVEINRIRFLSNTFVPKDIGRGDDGRTLAMPIRLVSTGGAS